MPRSATKKPMAAARDLCEVARLGIRIGDLFVAASEMDQRVLETADNAKKKAGEKISDDIRQWRDHLIDVASFERATSLPGALVHLALLRDIIEDLSTSHHSDQSAAELKSRADRMFESISVMLRRMMGEAAFTSVAPFADIYAYHNSLNWIDDMPTLIEMARKRRA